MRTVLTCVLLQLTLQLVLIVAYLTDGYSGRQLLYRNDDDDIYNSGYNNDIGVGARADDNDIDDNNDADDEDDDDDDDDDDDEYDTRPVFTSTERNLTVSPGEDALLRCSLRNLGSRLVMWRRLRSMHPLTIGDITFVSDARVSIDHVVHREVNGSSSGDWSEWNLRIRNVRTSDDGIYQCQVNTKDDQKNVYNVHLHVTIIHVTGTESVEKGKSIHLLCNATGRPDPPHNVEWFKNDRMIESDANGGIIITKKIETRLLVSALVIQRSKVTDAGEYHCRSSEQDVGKISVYIQSAPLEKRGTSAEQIMSGNTSPMIVNFRWFFCVVCFAMTSLLR